MGRSRPSIQLNMKTLIFSVTFLALVASVHGATSCARDYEKVGCFHDSFRTNADRVFPNELYNIRDPLSNQWNGYTLNWRNFPESIHDLTCKCAELARSKGWAYFGTQFYGECWSGPSMNYGRDGNSIECIGNDYRPCDDKSETECVGKAFTNYVYKLKAITFNNAIHGGWSTWSDWTRCSKSCGGGKKSRTRTCTDPRPAFGGAACEGDAKMEKPCNVDVCETKCESEMDIGIILDASTSVTRRNWDNTLKFVNKLSKIFTIGPKHVKFGVIRFSWFPSMQFSFSDNKYWSSKSFEDKVSTIRYTYGGTRTDRALEMAEKQLMCSKCGTRKEAHKALLVITDGVPSLRSEPMDKMTRQLKKDGVTIVAVGVGKLDYKILQQIATDDNHVITLDGYTYIDDPINKLVRLLCNRAPVAFPGLMH